MMNAAFPFARPAAPGLVLVVSLMLGACSGVFQQPEKRPCPPVRIEASTAELTRFQPGAGRDLTDVVLQAEVTGYDGSCQYADDGQSVRVDLTLEFGATLGPAAESRTQSFRYFVAVPRFYPDPAGKSVFEATVSFPSGTDRIRYVGEELRVTVPIDPAEGAVEMPVYIGFQLSAAQVDYNRGRAPIVHRP